MTKPVATVTPGGPRFPNPAPWDGDPAYLVTQACLILRIDPINDPDVPRIERLAYAVTDSVRAFLDEPLPFDDLNQTAAIADPITDACVSVLVEWYRRKDAPFGVVGAWSPDGVAIRVSRDWLDPVRHSLQPYKQRFGIA